MRVFKMAELAKKHQNKARDNITIIGFATAVPLKNKIIALIIGGLLSLRGCNILAGNIVGTFRYAFCSAKLFGGKTFALVDKKISRPPLFIDSLMYVPSNTRKHQQVALLSRAAIIIGGGGRSLHLVKEFIKQGKPVIAISDTHGIVDNEIEPLGVKISGFYHAVNYILFKLR